MNNPGMAQKEEKTGKLVQASLFEEIPVSSSDESSEIIRIASADSAELSPLQKKFNAQVQKIEHLRREIEETAELYNQLLGIWAKKLEPVLNETGRLHIKLAFALEAQALGFKLGVRQRETAGDLILELLDSAFCQIPAEQDAQDLFSRWNEISFDEKISSKEDDFAQSLGEMIRDRLGVDIDDKTIREGPEAIKKKIEESVLNAESNRERKPRKKTARQLEKEERERQAQAFEKKSLRSLYLSLVKVLHPDAELDETSKTKKEKIMKDLTSAYEAGDLHTLLRIEKDWIDRETANSAPLPDEKLKAYISALKEQALDLENELDCLGMSPRFEPIQSLIGYGLDGGKQVINERVLYEKKRIALLKDMVAEFSKKLDKQTFMSRIRDMGE